MYRWRVGEEPAILRGPRDHPALGDLEGVCLDAEGGVVYAVAEGDGVVLAMRLKATERPKVARPKEVARLPRIGTKKNKGWEGCTVLPSRFREDGIARILLVHEGAPRALSILALPAFEHIVTLEIDALVEGVLEDLSDLAVCPETGHLFVSSDESEAVAEFTLSTDDCDLTLLGVHPLPLANESKPEGLAFTSDGDLLVVTDRSAELLRLGVLR